MRVKPACSPLWRSLSHCWPDFRANLCCLPGDGLDTHVWNYEWIPSLGPLCNFVQNRHYPVTHPHFHDLLDSNGNWNMGELCSILPANVIPHVLAIKPPGIEAGEDRCAWKWDRLHRFGVKSAYGKLVEDRWEAPCPLWKMIWSLKVPQRIRSLLWLVARDRLLSNHERHRRGLANKPVCPLRGVQLLSASSLNSFFTAPLDDWVQMNLGLSDTIPALHEPCTMPRTFLFLKQPLNNTPNQSPEKSLQMGGVIYTDASVDSVTSFSSVGGVLRSHDGTWLSGFFKGIGVTDPLQAELWGLYHGLCEAWRHGAELLQVQSDNVQAINLLKNQTAEDALILLVRSILQMCHRIWFVEFLWIPREGNIPTDSEGHRFSDPLPTVLSLVERDIADPPYIRVAGNNGQFSVTVYVGGSNRQFLLENKTFIHHPSTYLGLLEDKEDGHGSMEIVGSALRVAMILNFDEEICSRQIASYSRSTRSRLDKYSDRMDSTRTRLEFLTSRNELLDIRLEKLSAEDFLKPSPHCILPPSGGVLHRGNRSINLHRCFARWSFIIPHGYGRMAMAMGMKEDDLLKPAAKVFATIKDIEVGKTLPIYFPYIGYPTYYQFLPKQKTHHIPLSSEKLPELLRFFSFSPDSNQALAMK
ncbi:hypothetical protein F3Y22_tig00110676pilonHSYRG00049 [Hibiscus syriacus]|uniref:BURP domain-containing protein n=1 Tax=Hibiscus syriacus TaxID=106335 RepID=A0A6A2ZYX0_HIBSY|nr:hypothetical protein F3Y22_tig00110676pilonHSYRG00049 [Hibiscus syriacus]